MQDNFKLTVLVVPCILCVLIAGYMAVNQVDHWDWFLFTAILLMVNYKRDFVDEKE